MRNNLRYFNAVQIISNIILLITIVLFVIFNTNFLNNLYWTLIPVTFLGNLAYIGKWSKEGMSWYKEKDSSWNENLTRKTSEKLMFLLVAFALIYLALLFMEYFIPQIRTSYYTIIGLYLLTIAFEYYIFRIVIKTDKNIKSLIDEEMNRKERVK